MIGHQLMKNGSSNIDNMNTDFLLRFWYLSMQQKQKGKLQEAHECKSIIRQRLERLPKWLHAASSRAQPDGRGRFNHCIVQLHHSISPTFGQKKSEPLLFLV